MEILSIIGSIDVNFIEAKFLNPEITIIKTKNTPINTIVCPSQALKNIVFNEVLKDSFFTFKTVSIIVNTMLKISDK